MPDLLKVVDVELSAIDTTGISYIIRRNTENNISFARAIEDMEELVLRIAQESFTLGKREGHNHA